jgi:predicted phage tail protein
LSNGGSAITGYDVYEGTTSGAESTTPVNGTTPITTTSYPATGLTNGTTYYFTVKAVNAAGLSAASNQASATPATVPGAPTGLSATAGNTTVALKWTAPTSNGGSPVTGYYVYLGTKSGGESTTPLNFTPLTTTSCTVTGLTKGTTYYFTVKAVNAVGSSAASNQASATPAIVPGAPTGLSATPGNTTVALKWTAPASNGGSPVTGYNVYEGTGSGGESTTPVNGATLITATSYTVSGLTNGTTYYFTVKAVNAVGSSATSNQASAVAGAPVAVADQYSTVFDATLTVSAPGVLANDILNGATIVSYTNPAHGFLTLNASGSFTYKPAFLFFGTDSFTYTLNNAWGSSVATVTIKVNV